MDERTFHEQTKRALAIPPATDRQRQLYTDLEGQLLEEPCRLLQRDRGAAVAAMVGEWQRALRKWGRRRGFADEKHVLDVLSYESRAAFHRAYSAVWMALLPGLTRALALTDIEQRFVRVWQLSPCTVTHGGASRFHWFHGHVFGLHPAGSLLMQTPTGRTIMGRYLTAVAKDEDAAAGRLRHAMSRAVMVYMMRREDDRDERRRRPCNMDGEGLQTVENRKVERRAGRSHR